MSLDRKQSFLLGYAFALGILSGRRKGVAEDDTESGKVQPRDHGRYADEGKGYAKGQAAKRQGKKKPIDEKVSFVIDTLIENAHPWREIEATAGTWKQEFPEGKVRTPIGDVKIGENQFNKLLFSKDRRSQFAGLIKPTLEKPTYIVSRVESPERIAERIRKGEAVERASVLQFIRAFEGKTNGHKGFLVASVSRDGGIEVSITAHRRDVEELAKMVRNGGVLLKGERRG